MHFRAAGLAVLVFSCVPAAPPESDAGYVPRDTVRVDATFFDSRGIGSFPCADGDGGSFEPSTWRLELATRQLSWRLCAAMPGGPVLPPGQVGSRVLAPAEVESFERAMRGMTPAAQVGCGADGDSQILDVITSSATARYWGNEPGQCLTGPNFVILDNMRPVFDVLTQASR